MAFADLYEIKDNQASGGSALLNIYQVTKLNPSFTATNILNAYFDTIYDAVRAIQPSTVSHNTVEVRSLSDPLDFASGVQAPDTGTLAGEALANFVALTIQFNRLRTDMKNGQKRWTAGSETSATVNQWAAGILAVAATLGTAIVGNWEETANPGIPVCRYIVLARWCTTSPSPPCAGTYRLPENDTEAAKSYIPTTFLVQNTIRSQVSRKRLV